MPDTTAGTGEADTSNLLRNAFTASIGKVFWDVASRSLTLLLSILLARNLGAQGYGIYAVAWYVAWMLAQVTDLGLHIVTLRSLAKTWEPRVVASAVAAKALVSALLIGGFAAVSASPILSTNVRLLWLLLAVSLLVSWIELFGVILRSRGRIAREGIVLTVLRLGLLAGALIAIRGNAGLEGIALALVLGAAPGLWLALAWMAKAWRRTSFRPDWLEVRGLYQASLPLAVSAAITIVYLRADLLILAALRGATDAGIFASAFRLFEAMFVLSGGIVAGSFPLLAARFGQRGFPSLSRFVLTILLLVAIPAATGLFALAGPIIGFLFGEGFTEAARPLTFLAVALVAVFMNALTTHLLIVSGRMRYLVGCMTVRLTVGILLDLVLIPRYGAVGAAGAVAGAEWSLALVTLLPHRRLFPLSVMAGVVASSLAASLIMAISILHLDAPLPLKLPAGIIIYGLLIVAAYRCGMLRGSPLSPTDDPHSTERSAEQGPL